MKPLKGTIQWLAPHLSDGEVQAIYEACLRVIGKKYSVGADFKRNELIDDQRAALDRLFGKEN